MKIIVTGGAGFIGSHLIDYILEVEEDAEILNFDKLTYAASEKNNINVSNNKNYTFYKGDIVNKKDVELIINDFEPDVIFHLAAESHVDRSISNAEDFINTNIVGTYNLLEKSLDYYNKLSLKNIKKDFKFINVSTDEVFGALGKNDSFTEASPYAPNSPYSASKASADHLARAYHKTYSLPVIITHSSNNYGPRQFPEKLIPVVILAALEGKELPIYGDGKQVRDWLYVKDHASALWEVSKKGVIGDKYCIGSENEIENIFLVENLCKYLDFLLPDSKHNPHARLITYVQDRLGHDYRYSILPDKMKNEIGWKAKKNFEEGIKETVTWYINNYGD